MNTTRNHSGIADAHETLSRRAVTLGTLVEARQASRFARRRIDRKPLRTLAAAGVVGLGLGLMSPNLAQAEFGATFSLDSLDGTNGFVFQGNFANDAIGRSVSGAGDINGDGFNDIIVGAHNAQGEYDDSTNTNTPNGQTYVIFGGQTFSPTLRASALNGSNGFRIGAEVSTDRAGYDVSVAGDVNGDGIDDLIIGAPWAETTTYDYTTTTGKAYVVFGKTTGFGSSLSLSDLDGSNGFEVTGVSEGSLTGTTVSSAGDVNNDGFDDLIISGRRSNQVGPTDTEAFVLFGGNGFGSTFDPTTLDGTNGYRIQSAASNPQILSASGVGDINGDGFDDVAVGDFGAPTSNDYNDPDFLAGETYVIYGQTDAMPAIITTGTTGQPDDYFDGINGFTIRGATKSAGAAYVSDAGDVNGDGIDDLVVHSPAEKGSGEYDFHQGATYVLFGTNTGFSSLVELNSIDGTNGFRFAGDDFYDLQAFDISSAGDINGDGFDDIIVGAFDQNDNDNGAFVLYGSGDPYPTNFTVGSINGTNGFVITTGIEDYSPDSFSNLGDINGDGIDDIVLGAPRSDFSSRDEGRAYIIFGQQSTVIPEPTTATGLLAGVIGLLSRRWRTR